MATVGIDINGYCLEEGNILKNNEKLFWLNDSFCENDERRIIRGSRKI